MKGKCWKSRGHSGREGAVYCQAVRRKDHSEEQENVDGLCGLRESI